MKKLVIALTMILAFAGASFAADAATPADDGPVAAKKAEKKDEKKAEKKVKKTKKSKKTAATEKKAE